MRILIALGGNALPLLTDVDAVYEHWAEPRARAIRRISPRDLRQLGFAPGSIAPKVAAACDFVERTGGIAAIGQLKDARSLLDGTTGTLISRD